MRPGASVPTDLDKVCSVGLVRARPMQPECKGPLVQHRVILIHTSGLHKRAFSDWSEDID